VLVVFVSHIGAYIRKEALVTEWLAGFTYISTVQNEPVVSSGYILLGNVSHEGLLGF
jgi:hypothetical protein